MKSPIKEQLHQLIDKCDDPSLLEDAKAILQDQNPSYDWWDDLSEEDRNLVKESEAQYGRGSMLLLMN